MQPVHSRPTEDRAVPIDNKIARAHGSLIPWQLAVVRPRISLVWRVSARAASIFAWPVCARDKLYDVFVWRGCEVVDPCVPSIGRAGQARKNWALPQFAGARISGPAERVLSLYLTEDRPQTFPAAIELGLSRWVHPRSSILINL